MRVLVSPRLHLEIDRPARAAAWALAGPRGSVVSLREMRIGNLARRLSQAEVTLLRAALWAGTTPRGREAGKERACLEDGPVAGRSVVGYLCGGVPVGGVRACAAQEETEVVAVTDHAGLTWQSPLTGPNDESVGPRFPSMTGVYSPHVVLQALEQREGIILTEGVVAGVRDDMRPTAYETEIATAQGHVALSSELVPVVIVAAHLGLRVAAGLMPVRQM